MDAMLQRHCARYIYIVPNGLRELMSDISREVIRSQPEQIYTFIADYLDALMITRENARVAARIVQSITEISENIIDLLQETGMARAEAEQVAEVMQASFRKYLDIKLGQKAEDITEEEIIQEILENAGVSIEEADKAAIVIQQAFRKFKEKKDREKELLTGMIDWRVAARSAIYLYRRTGVTDEEAHRAATLIKAAYKGYYTRKFMKKLAQEAAHIFDGSDQSSRSSRESEDEYDRDRYDTLSGDEEDEPRIFEYESTLPSEDLRIIRSVMDEIVDQVLINVGEVEPTSKVDLGEYPGEQEDEDVARYHESDQFGEEPVAEDEGAKITEQPEGDTVLRDEDQTGEEAVPKDEGAEHIDQIEGETVREEEGAGTTEQPEGETVPTDEQAEITAPSEEEGAPKDEGAEITAQLEGDSAPKDEGAEVTDQPVDEPVPGDEAVELTGQPEGDTAPQEEQAAVAEGAPALGDEAVEITGQPEEDTAPKEERATIAEPPAEGAETAGQPEGETAGITGPPEDENAGEQAG